MATADLFRGLHPALVPYAVYLYEYAQWAGLRPRVTSVRRTFQQQSVLYDRFKRGMSSLPAAPPGHSAHERGLAFDMTVSNPEWTSYVWHQMGGTWGASDWVHYEFR